MHGLHALLLLALQLFSLAMPAGVSLPDPSALGNFSVAQSNVATGPTVVGLRSQTTYRACVVAADETRLHNKQPAVSYKDFTTLDITPPTLVASPVPGQDGNFTCSRYCHVNIADTAQQTS